MLRFDIVASFRDCVFLQVYMYVCVPQQLINRMRKQRARVKEGLSERACAVGNSVNTTVQ